MNQNSQTKNRVAINYQLSQKKHLVTDNTHSFNIHIYGQDTRCDARSDLNEQKDLEVVIGEQKIYASVDTPVEISLSGECMLFLNPNDFKITAFSGIQQILPVALHKAQRNDQIKKNKTLKPDIMLLRAQSDVESIETPFVLGGSKLPELGSPNIQKVNIQKMVNVNGDNATGFKNNFRNYKSDTAVSSQETSDDFPEKNLYKCSSLPVGGECTMNGSTQKDLNNQSFEGRYINTPSKASSNLVKVGNVMGPSVHEKLHYPDDKHKQKKMEPGLQYEDKAELNETTEPFNCDADYDGDESESDSTSDNEFVPQMFFDFSDSSSEDTENDSGFHNSLEKKSEI